MHVHPGSCYQVMMLWLPLPPLMPPTGPYCQRGRVSQALQYRVLGCPWRGGVEHVHVVPELWWHRAMANCSGGRCFKLVATR
jgi:hypothetical protein